VSRARSEWGAVAVALVIAAAAVAALRLAVVRDVSEPGFELFPDMVRGPGYPSQSDGAPTDDGLSDRPLPEGVVVRGRAPFRYGPGPDEGARAGRELASPLPADGPDADAAAERGARIYARMCVVCHGADGQGDGAAVRRGMLPPPSLTAERAMNLADGQLFHVLTRGQGNMASYAAQVARDDRWRVVLHLRLHQAAARAKEGR
jgi:mono/diheme cytochrome c family protein